MKQIKTSTIALTSKGYNNADLIEEDKNRYVEISANPVIWIIHRNIFFGIPIFI